MRSASSRGRSRVTFHRVSRAQEEAESALSLFPLAGLHLDTLAALWDLVWTGSIQSTTILTVEPDSLRAWTRSTARRVTCSAECEHDAGCCCC